MEKGTILVVDNEQFFLETIVDTLNSSDYKVLQAKNGKMGLKVAEKFMPDIVITDWDMPEMDGIEMIKAFKKSETLSDIPIIMCTGIMTTSEDLQIALNAGAIDYIRKPIDKIELIARVNSMLKLSRSYIKIKKLNNFKDKVLSVLGHDLRDPVGAIKTFIELVLNRLDSYDQKKLINSLQKIKEQANLTYSLLERILLWAKTQRGSAIYEPRENELNTIIEESIMLYYPNALEKNITLESQITKPLYAYFDKESISVVLRNLISNALKFTPNGGKITISTRKNEQQLIITVADTGVGISKELQKRIFLKEEFYSTYGTNDEKGSGLGLILCSEFTKMNKGKIWVDSSVGKGSSFNFTLPLYK